MPFEQSVWDDSDPTYAPCLAWGGRNSTFAYWVAPKRYVRAGWAIKRLPLGRGHKDQPVDLEMAAKCRELTRDMLRWYEDDKPMVDPGSWHWLIGRYKCDTYSPYRSVKANTRHGYNQSLAQVDAVMGGMMIEQTTYETLMQIKQGKQDKGRSKHHIHTWFSTLRRVARYGVLINAPGAARVSEMLGNLRIEAPAARSKAATHDQIMAIVRAADAEGRDVFAVGLLMQWWFGLRAVDVRGQYLDGKWADGITWGMFDDDMTGFEKVISKTRKSLPEAYHFDVTIVPGLRQRLLEIKASLPHQWIQPDRPIAVNRRTGRAFTPSGWTQTWADLRAKAGVPKDVWMMDTRAGAITEASSLPGVTTSQLRNAAQHKDAATTGRYIRERSNDLNTVVRLRANRN